MAKKNYFDQVDPQVNFPKLEKELLEHWYKNGIVNKYLHKNDKSGKYFSFLDGPITANNPMGVHHAWGRTYKDLWQRFKNMQGYKQRFQNGFDCQGLWVEVEVEKELGIKNKKDIENLIPGDKKASIAKFVELCKARVLKFSSIQTEQTKRLGNFMDWDNSYYTMSDENNYMIWHFLKVCYENGWIYKGRDSVPWCPRCETAISQHEMLTEDYKEVTHDSVYIRYPIVGQDKTFLLVWTTTPWTLPGNVAVAVDEKRKYVEAWDGNGNRYYVSRYAATKLELKDLREFSGNALVEKTYETPFDELPRIKKTMGLHPREVIATNPLILPISEEEGTGLVHIAPGAGAEDFQLGKSKNNLPLIELIDEEANYIDGLGGFSGLNAKKHPDVIIDYLKEKDGGRFLFKVAPITHRYPACWRCKTELVWRVADEWYIAMDKGKTSLRERMVRVARKIKWLPSFGLERELDWLKNMHDWLISKPNRYWGLALPIYECKKCGNFEVLGSREELKEKAVAGWDKFAGHTPHKPWIDEVKIKCSKCGAIVERLPDVGNVWLDAGIVPYSTITKDNRGEPLYQTDKSEWRKWFPADFITESFPGQFKNWFYSMIAMSTVLEDENPFKTVLGFASLLAENGKPMHKSWGNAIEFNEGADKIGVDVMRWMYVRQNPLDNLLFGYRIADETRRKFHLKLWNVYNYFISYANLNGFEPKAKLNSKNTLDVWILARFNETVKITTDFLEKYDAYNASGAIEKFVDDLSNWYIRRSRGRSDTSFYQTTFDVLVTLTELIAPFMPFVTEEIYRNLTKKDSVHLSDWPVPKALDSESLDLLEKMRRARELVERVHSLRKEAGIPLRQPLGFLTTNVALSDELKNVIKDEINVKEIVKGKTTARLDTKVTPELEAEGKAREIVRSIQEERKRLGTALDEKVTVTLPSWPKEFEDEIKKRALVSSVKTGEFKVSRLK